MLNRFDRKQRNWRFGQIDTAAERCGIDVVHLGPNAPPSLLCRDGEFNFGLDVTRPSWVPPLTELLSNNKFLTKILLDGLKVPVPSGEICRTQKEARAAFERMQGAVVMKPVFGTEAKGVTLNIATLETCNAAFDYAKSQCSKDLVLVEDYVRGVDLRLLFLGETLVAAYLRLPANVVGDGVRSISDLVAEKNDARISLPSTQENQLIKLEIKHRRLLTLQGYAPEDCPESGRVVLMGVSPNYIDGADLLPITDQLHPDVIALAQEAVRAIDPKGFWGVDLLTEDFTKPRSKAKTVLCEVNSRPVGGVFRYATHGKHVHFFEEAFKTVRAAPDAFKGPSTQRPTEEAKSPKPDIRDRFEDQVAKVIQETRPRAMFLTPDIALERKRNKTEFYLLNPNPSFLRGALFPWRWLSLRALLEARGVTMTRLHPPEEFGGQDGTPIGRAFLTMARSKMRTVWIETIKSSTR
jgi:D-alanine-D-alanine ligase-like ATP-grasp enzyme